jgi:very-short-patch-repair endonuclease
MLQGTEQSTRLAKQLRQEMSPAEIVLWLALQSRPGGLKFRKQHPSGPFVADFYCHRARLVIEVDGEAHGYGDRPQRDANRDAWFAARKLLTLRVSGREVLRDVDAVARGIVDVAEQRIREQ